MKNRKTDWSQYANTPYQDSSSLGQQLSDELRALVQKELPNYMVPSLFIPLESLPLTANGKVDRKALPDPQQQRDDGSYEAPRNDVEQRLADIWQTLLTQSSIGIHDNFFELGGDSILSIQVVTRARQVGLQLAVHHMFEHQTIAALAVIAQVGSTVVVDAEQGMPEGDLPLTPIQHWFLMQGQPEPHHFNHAVWLTVPADVDVAALRGAFAAVIQQHDALRLRFASEGSQWRQHFAMELNELPFSEEVIASSDGEQQVMERSLYYQRSLDLSEGPLTRLVLFRFADKIRLFWVIHHLAVDGVSWRPLLEDLHSAYLQRQLPAKTSSYKAWSERLQQYRQSEALNDELAYWQMLPSLPLPLDFPEGQNRREFHQDVVIYFNQEETQALLRDTSIAYNTRINDLLLSALAMTLSDVTGELRSLIEIEGHGRSTMFEDIDLSRTVGWFTAKYPVLFNLPSAYANDVGTVLKRVKEQLRGVPGDGMGYDLLGELGGISLAHADVVFNYMGQFDQGHDAGAFSMVQEPMGDAMSMQGPRPHLLEINAFVTQGQLSVRFSYSRDCHQAETIEGIAQQYQSRLQQLIGHCAQGKLGVTPSDFPLAAVDQPTLDQIFDRYPDFEDIYPLTPMQEGMLFHSMLHPESGEYFEQMLFSLSHLDPSTFKRAWQLQLERHPIFRSAFLVNSQPMLQVVQKTVPLHWREHDWRQQSASEQDEQLEALLAQKRSAGFKLQQAPLISFDLVRLADDRFTLVLHTHHVLLDGWSIPLVLNEVRSSYVALRQQRIPSLPVRTPFRDYIAWQQQQSIEEAQHYWQQRLAGFTSPTQLPIQQHNNLQPDYRKVRFSLEEEYAQRLQQFSQSQRVTLNTMMQASWSLLLARYSGDNDVCFGVTVSGRNAALHGIEEIVGMLINTLPLRLQLDSGQTVHDFLMQVQSLHQADNRYAYSSLGEIQQHSEIDKGTSLFESMLAVENYPQDDVLKPQDDCYRIDDVVSRQATNFPLTVMVIPEKALEFYFLHDASRIDEESINRLWGHLRTLIVTLMDSPEMPIAQLAMLTTAEEAQLKNWNDTAGPVPNCTLLQLFEQQVARVPDNIALIYPSTGSGTVQLSYDQLNAQANQLAHHILQHESMANDSPLIAVVVERSPMMIISVLAVLKSGAAYVPIDPEYPAERIQRTLEGSGAGCVISHSHVLEQLSLPDSMQVITVEELDLSHQSTTNPAMDVEPDDLAYVIFTSGSTGLPKGVVISHRSAVNTIEDINERFGVSERDRVLALSSLSFDLSVYDIFGLLAAGGAIVLPDAASAREPARWAALVCQHGVTIWDSVPALMQIYVDYIDGQAELNPDALRLVMMSGDWIPTSLPNKINKRAPQAQVISLGGATEASIWSIHYPIDRVDAGWKSIPYGKPLRNQQFHVLNDALEPCPVQVPGSLYIGGIGLAQGYWRDEERTTASFIIHPVSGERLYKTGDLGRYLADGNIEFLGRDDFQVKINGFRIELGDIEASLRQHPEVEDALVILRGEGDNKFLAAYFTTQHAAAESAPLHDWLQQHLPAYMLPKYIIPLDSFPLTANGKIDRHALPLPEMVKADGEQPFTPNESLLATVWAKLLKIETVNREDNFFALGGNSLLAMQLTARIREVFQIEVPVRIIFEQATLLPFAQAMENHRDHIALPPIIKQAADSTPPLSFAQKRLWFLDQLEGSNNATYNISLVLRLSGALNTNALEQALSLILLRHGSLRTRFTLRDGQADICVMPASEMQSLQFHDLRSLPDDEKGAEVMKRSNAYPIAPFDLSKDALFRADCLLVSGDESVLMLNMHHIVSDGWSMVLFLNEWQQAYAAFSQEETPSLPPLEIEYSDYATWQQDWMQGEVLEQQTDYWKEQLAGIPELIALPTDRPRSNDRSYHGEVLGHPLTQELSQQLTALSQQQESTTFMTLMAAFNLLLSRYSGQDDVCVGTPVANRTQQQTENLIGFFVNTLVLRTNFSTLYGDGQQCISFIDLLKDARQTCLGAYAHQDIPFEIQVEVLQPTRSISHSPLFQVMFAIEDDEVSQLTLPELHVSVMEVDYPIAKFDLTLTIQVMKDKSFTCWWEYATDIFDKSTIKGMAEHFELLLQALVENPQADIRALPLTMQDEASQIRQWNETTSTHSRQTSLADLFEAQVERTPDALAVILEDQRISFRQINAQANVLAHQLIGQGVTANTLVGIWLERSPELLVAVLAVWKAGGAYLPLNPDYPVERSHFMLHDSGTKILLTQGHLDIGADALSDRVIIDLNDLPTQTAQDCANPVRSNNPDDLAYVIYTSGSTGKPKGVSVGHGPIALQCRYMRDYYEIHQHDRVLQFLPINFDPAIQQIFCPWLSGASLIMLNERLLDPVMLIDYLGETEATVVDIPAPYWQQMCETADVTGKLNKLRLLIFAGDIFPLPMAHRTQQLFPQVRVINEYGPTEAVIASSLYTLPNPLPQHMTSVPIGRPTADTKLYILNTLHQIQPIGVAGELCIAGESLAQGYLNRPELTARQFIEVALLGETQRLYKTGDLARWLPDGNIEYIGRIDHQVKLRGFRIELGEIEAVLRLHPAVDEAVVLVREEGGSQLLIAYLTVTQAINAHDLRPWLNKQLPDYMVPAAFCIVDQMPIAASGKIDRKLLASQAVSFQTQTEQGMARDVVELQLLAIWETVLRQNGIGIHDNFFDLGGHSLLAMSLMSQIQQNLGQRLSIGALFESPTIAGLATMLRDHAPDAAASCLVPIRTTEGENGIMFLIPEAVGSVMYLYPLASSLDSSLSVYALQTPGLDGSQPMQSVAELAAFHIHNMRRQQPEGPYRLAGHSSGGRVVYEIAWQLEQQGETVEMLAILDTFAPNSPLVDDPMDDYHDYNWLHDIVFAFEATSQTVLKLPLQNLMALNDLDAAYNKVMSVLQQHSLFAPGTPVDELKAMVNVYRSSCQIDRQYQMPGTLHCPIHLFCASEPTGGMGGLANPELVTQGWPACTDAEVIEHWVAGDHMSMVFSPQVEKLGEIMSACLGGDTNESS